MGKRGPKPKPPRDGDRRQAMRRTGVRVRSGELPPPREVPCTDCGHLGDDRRHEYDHFLGYGAEHHDDVEAVCKLCHVRREIARGRPIGRPRKSAAEKAQTAAAALERRRARRRARVLVPPLPPAPIWLPPDRRFLSELGSSIGDRGSS